MLLKYLQYDNYHNVRWDRSKLWPVTFVIVIIIYVVSLIVTPIVYDTMHLPDTLFMLNSGWRVSLGLQPGIDYNTFYSGLTSRYLALSYDLFGFNVKALDMTVLLQYTTLLPLVFMATVGRVNLLTFSAVAAVVATTVLTRAPMEEFTAITEMMSAHSFSYNRFGLSLCLVSLLAVLLPVGSRHQEGLAGLAAGISITMALMTKLSFITVLPPIFIALLLQRRWIMLVATFVGLILTAVSLDITGQQFLGTASYAIAATGAEDGMVGLSSLLFKTQRILMSHIFVILAITAALTWTLCALQTERWSWGLSVVFMTAGLGTTCLVMGPSGLIGHQILPVAVILVLIFVEQMRRHDMTHEILTRSLALMLALGLILPHVGNAILVTAAAFRNNNDGLVSEGPMTAYLQKYENAAPGRSIDQVNTDIAMRIAQEGRVTRALEYPVFADGLAALQLLSLQGQHGIIAEGKFNFEFAVSAPPVTNYPLWPRVTSPELMGQTQIPDGADIVMLLRQGSTPLGSALLGWMAQEFEPCLETPIWAVYKRSRSKITNCSAL